LGGEQAFNKVLGTSAWYFPLFWNTVFFVKGRGGWVEQRESDGTLPVYQKFMIGGINTVRGFEFHEITPRDPATLDRLGGEQMVIFNLEYRFPLIKEQGIVGLVFFDAGNVFTDNPDALTVDGLRTGAGVGVRWFSPMGPLRLEWGRNLDPLPGEKDSVWEFTIGGTF
jgi:outer membrane protein insertion porin family